METIRRAAPTSGEGLDHAERDACLHALGELHAAGQLTFPELETRIQAALAAKTAAELAGLVRDRPDEQTGARSPLGGEAEASTKPLVSLGAALLAGVVAVVSWCCVQLRTAVHRSSRALADLRRSQAAAVPTPEPPATAPQDLVVAPRPQIPVQRQPIKVYAVRVPMDQEPSPEPATSSVPELPSAARRALPPGPAGDEVQG